jgi:hypothetical protein
MSITKVGDAQAAAATIDLSGVGITTGDFVLIHAYRNGSTAVPSSPGASWTDLLTSAGANTNSRRVGYRFILAGDNLATISGTWTNATRIQFIALRGVKTGTPTGGTGSGGTNTTTLTTPGVTMTDTAGGSWVVAFAGTKATNANTVTLSSTTDDGSSQGALNLATGRGVTSYVSRNYSAAVDTAGNRMDAVEVLVAPLSATTSDSIDSLDDSPSRALTLPRTTSESVSSLSETATKIATLARTIADSIDSLAESVSRLLTFNRTDADSIGPLTESPTRVGTIIRSMPDSISTLTQSVVRTFTGSRTVAETVSLLTEIVNRTLTGARIAADTITSITQSVAAGLSFSRTLADSVGSISESVVRGAVSFVRSVADLMSGVAESADRVAISIRAGIDDLPSLSETTERVMIMIRDGADSLPSVAEAITQSSVAVVRVIVDGILTILETVGVISGGGPIPDYIFSAISASKIIARIALRKIRSTIE